MAINIFVSSLMFLCMIVIGHVLMFVTAYAYWLCPLYTLMLIMLQGIYKENCKTMERKDFIITLCFVGSILIWYFLEGNQVTVDLFSFLYLATFLPYISYASSIRFKSLI